MITVGGVPLASDPGAGGGSGGGVAAYVVGPFTLAGPISAGSDPDPAESDPAPVGYGFALGGGEATAWVAPRPGSITAITVSLTASASGSDVRVFVIVGEEGFYPALAAVLAQPGRSTRLAITAGDIPIAAGEEVLLAVQVGSGWNSLAALAAAIEFTPEAS